MCVLVQILPFVIPKLVSIPVSAANARALAAIVDVTTTTIQVPAVLAP
jgi:hypothetical protein